MAAAVASAPAVIGGSVSRTDMLPWVMDKREEGPTGERLMRKERHPKKTQNRTEFTHINL